LFYFQVKKKTPKKKFELKFKGKKNCNRAKPTASPTNYRGIKPTDSQIKKRKRKKEKKSNTSVPKGLNQKSLKAL